MGSKIENGSVRISGCLQNCEKINSKKIRDFQKLDKKWHRFWEKKIKIVLKNEQKKKMK